MLLVVLALFVFGLAGAVLLAYAKVRAFFNKAKGGGSGNSSASSFKGYAGSGASASSSGSSTWRGRAAASGGHVGTTERGRRALQFFRLIATDAVLADC